MENELVKKFLDFCFAYTENLLFYFPVAGTRPALLERSGGPGQGGSPGGPGGDGGGTPGVAGTSAIPGQYAGRTNGFSVIGGWWGGVCEDDADSGYHTGSNTLQSKAQRAAAAGGAGGAPQPVAPRPPGEWTLTREELRRQIEAFNNNNHGLIMSLQQETNTFQGFIRVHMNLIRPINMSLSARPASIYDVMGQSDDEESDTEAEITSFYLPKDTTKVIHINSSTTTQEVIRTLLSKFKITDNPRKFALYEKIQEEGKKDLMRRLEDAEQPLPCCLSWTLESLALLDKRKFVLQENDTGEIMWEAFSLPELENFLRILDREEDEYVDQVKAKYRMLRVQMQQRLKDLEPASEPPSGEDKREPVYV